MTLKTCLRNNSHVITKWTKEIEWGSVSELRATAIKNGINDKINLFKNVLKSNQDEEIEAINLVEDAIDELYTLLAKCNCNTSLTSGTSLVSASGSNVKLPKMEISPFFGDI